MNGRVSDRSRLATTPSSENSSLRKSAVWGAVLTVLLGLVLWATVDPKLSAVNLKVLDRLSFDSLLFTCRTAPKSDILIVAMDEESRSRLGQAPEALWDRSLHAQLTDTLRTGGARAIVFDVLFADPWPDPEVDVKLAQALTRAEKVVLAASLRNFESLGEGGGGRVLLPIEPLASIASGIVELPRDPDGALRRHPEAPKHTHLATRTAQVLGLQPADARRARWINYYSARSAIPRMSYWQALKPDTLAPDIYSNKVVFIGRAPTITPLGANTGDEYPTPYTRWTGHLLSGVEIQATVFSNLLHRDWIQRLNDFAQVALLVACGALLGFGLALFRPLPALGWAIAAAVLTFAGAAALFSMARLWFPWVIVAGFQVPFAFGWSVLGYLQRAAQAKDIPDHTLLRCVGRGAYGEVWLARNAIGSFHAVKIVQRKRFANREPFDREFRGIQTFAPISRSHRGLVHILHVGRNDLRGCFYYVMEPADDERTGSRIDPDTYCPKTLAQELHRRKRLPVAECLRLGLELSSALDHLHRKQLIHRDIKPANIIFVNDQPKLADVGLVRAINNDSTVTQIGSSGYIAPEGPGSPAADLFALGKTLYEAASGCECGRFPELPSELEASLETDTLLRLHEILLTACETTPADRYESAAAMHAALSELEKTLRVPARTT